MNEITLPRSVLSAMLADAAEIGANAAMGKAGMIRPYLSKQEAFKTYGRTVVERWIKEGLVTPRKDGSDTAKWRIDRTEIESVAKASNRPSYTMVTERK